MQNDVKIKTEKKKILFQEKEWLFGDSKLKSLGS